MGVCGPIVACVVRELTFRAESQIEVVKNLGLLTENMSDEL